MIEITGETYREYLERKIYEIEDKMNHMTSFSRLSANAALSAYEDALAVYISMKKE